VPYKMTYCPTFFLQHDVLGEKFPGAGLPLGEVSSLSWLPTFTFAGNIQKLRRVPVRVGSLSVLCVVINS
jgi:hypothetical protein